MAFKPALRSLAVICVLSLVMLCVSLGSCTPIVDKAADSACIPPGIPCDLSGQACCPGYECTQTLVTKKAYCVQTKGPPFIMARSGFFSGPHPQFMGMDTIPLDILSRDASAKEEDCKQFTNCNLAAPECCGDLICRGTRAEDSYCVVKPKPTEYGTKTNCHIEGNNDHQCTSAEDCCKGYYCQRYPSNLRHAPKCLPVDQPFHLLYTKMATGDTHFGGEATSCQSSLDCQPGYDCSQQGSCSPAAPIFAPHDKTTSIKTRGEDISCQSYRDCPDGYRCSSSNDKDGVRDGVCTAVREHYGWLVSRSNSEIVQEFEFPELPTSWCTQESCPCYLSSPCEMGRCDNFDERLIGKCRKFRPGEGADLQPGFPIDTVRCTYTGCPCSKWYDHCWNGVCDGLNRPGFGKCRPFSPMEEPKNNRLISAGCTDVGCVCDRGNFPCKNSQCIIRGVNKYGRCRRFDSFGNVLHARQEFDARCRTKGCPCQRQSDCLEGVCANNANGIGRCKVTGGCTSCSRPRRDAMEQHWYREDL